MTTTTRRYYARSWIYGVATDANTGAPVCNYRSFATRAERDAWVEGGASSRTERDYRQAVVSSDPDLRRVQALDARDEQAGEMTSDHYGARVARVEVLREYGLE